MSLDPLSDQILQRLPALTPQLVLGARFLVDHPDAVVTSSMRDIASQIGVAPATLVRLARALNYRDWTHLRDSYVGQFRMSSPHYAQKAGALLARQGVGGLIQEVQRAHAAALEHCATANSVESVDEAAKTLNRAPRIFVAAFLSCRAPGLAFSYICRLFRSNVTLLGTEGSSLVSDLEDIRSDDAVLTINFRPYAHDIHLVARAAERSGAALVSIADSRVTPVSAIARAILLFGTESPSFFPSITPAVALVESLTAAMLAHAGEGAVSRISSIERALYESGTYDVMQRGG